MKVNVELLAFGKPEEMREVIIFDISENAALTEVLEKVFYWGQNDFQPQPHPSVSVGDVVHYLGQRYLCLPMGFRHLTDAEYNEHKARERVDRTFAAYDYESNV